MLYRVCTLVVWLLLAVSGIGWWFEFTAPKGFTQGPVVEDAPAPPAIDPHALQQLLGARTAASPEVAVSDGQYQLQGIVTHGHEIGAALIADGNQAPHVYRIGMEVAPGLRVLSLEPRAVNLGPAGGPASQTLHLPNPGTVANTSTGPANTSLAGSRGAQAAAIAPPAIMPVPPAEKGH